MTTFHLGTSRAVIAFPGLGFVVKVARVQLGDVARLYRGYRRLHDPFGAVRKLARHFRRHDVDTLHMPRHSLFKGSRTTYARHGSAGPSGTRSSRRPTSRWAS